MTVGRSNQVKFAIVQFSCNVPSKVAGRVPTAAPTKSRFVAEKDGVEITLDKGFVRMTYDDGQEVVVPYTNVSWFVSA